MGMDIMDIMQEKVAMLINKTKGDTMNKDGELVNKRWRIG